MMASAATWLMDMAETGRGACESVTRLAIADRPGVFQGLDAWPNSASSCST